MNVIAVKDSDAVAEALTALREAERTLAAVADQCHERGLTVSELAERNGLSAAALESFAETAGRLLEGEELSPEEARRAAMFAAAGHVWERTLGPLLSGADVRELLGVSRQRVSELARGRRLVVLRERSGRLRYPLFQFVEGRALESLIAAFWQLADGALTPWTAASWCVSPHAELDGKTPAQWLGAGGDPDELQTVARRDAERLSH